MNPASSAGSPPVAERTRLWFGSIQKMPDRQEKRRGREVAAVGGAVDFLRGALPNVPVVGESATNPGGDNPLGMALLSILRASAHPRERFSEEHVFLTPLAGLLPSDPDRRPT